VAVPEYLAPSVSGVPLRRHWKLRGAVPVALTVAETVAPGATEANEGWLVMIGGGVTTESV